MEGEVGKRSGRPVNLLHAAHAAAESFASGMFGDSTVRVSFWDVTLQSFFFLSSSTHMRKHTTRTLFVYFFPVD